MQHAIAIAEKCMLTESLLLHLHSIQSTVIIVWQSQCIACVDIVFYFTKKCRRGFIAIITITPNIIFPVFDNNVENFTSRLSKMDIE